MIIVRVYKILDGKPIFHKILEKYNDSEPLPFELSDRDNMKAYLIDRYGEYRKSKEGLKYAFEIYKWGGEFISFFPGYDKEGNKLDLKYGRIDI